MVTVDSNVYAKKDMPWRIIEGEALVVDVNEGEVIHLNEVSAEIWKTIVESKGKELTPKDIANHICSVFEVDIATATEDVVEFLNILAEKKMVGY